MEFNLIIKKLNDSLSKEEEAVFLKWYEASHIHKEYFYKVKKNYQADTNNVNLQKAWLRLQSKIDARKKTNEYYKYATVASVVIILGLTVFFNNTNETEIEAPIIVDTVVVPGTDKATLTLEDGSQVSLEDEIAFSNKNLKSNGKEIIYNLGNGEDEIKYNYLTIPRGGQYFIKLSDGTQVWLNSESQLKFPVNFIKGQTRKVELLYGEAYFDVTSSLENNGAKFVVIHKSQDVQVLGTEFNIKAYNDETNVYTTLVEGKVQVDSQGKKQFLTPSQQLNLDVMSGNMIIARVDVESEISWKDGIFSFNGKPLKDIMKVISRWYDVDVAFESEELKELTFVGVLGKDQNLTKILETIKTLSIIKNYEIYDKKVTLK
tara:strand:- start:917 stop:2041 length:1125 start_codon:yes stop_codon:yes gene_type:complete